MYSYNLLKMYFKLFIFKSFIVGNGKTTLSFLAAFSTWSNSVVSLATRHLLIEGLKLICTLFYGSIIQYIL